VDIRRLIESEYPKSEFKPVGIRRLIESEFFPVSDQQECVGASKF
jgi:hypothetical protein